MSESKMTDAEYAKLLRDKATDLNVAIHAAVEAGLTVEMTEREERVIGRPRARYVSVHVSRPL